MSFEFIRFGLGGALLCGFAVAEVVLERSEMDRREAYSDYDDLLWNTDPTMDVNPANRETKKQIKTKSILGKITSVDNVVTHV